MVPPHLAMTKRLHAKTSAKASLAPDGCNSHGKAKSVADHCHDLNGSPIKDGCLLRYGFARGFDGPENAVASPAGDAGRPANRPTRPTIHSLTARSRAHSRSLPQAV
ncbi:hypothetical protein Brsp05_04461 [Brucella sp. NBRC 12953]